MATAVADAAAAAAAACACAIAAAVAGAAVDFAAIWAVAAKTVACFDFCRARQVGLRYGSTLCKRCRLQLC